MKTSAQVKKWGNSLAIRIPSRMATEMGLSNDSRVEITSDSTTAVIKREKNASASLEALVKAITPANVHKETDWGSPVGKEIW